MKYRLHLPGATPGETTLEGPPFHYLHRVLRLGAGDVLEVFDGAGSAFDATVRSVGESSLRLHLGDARPTGALRSVTVVQGLPKGDKLELVLQKCTELGASAFMPVSTARSVVKLDGKEAAKHARWSRIVEEAARQCHRSDVPVVHGVGSLQQLMETLPPGTTCFVLDEEETARRLSQALTALPSPHHPIALVVGAEGGLTRDEVQHLVARGAQPVTLGPLILRTETAALAAVAVVRHLDGQLG